MLCSLHTALHQIRVDLATMLAPATIRETCRAAGHRWRDRFDPRTVCTKCQPASSAVIGNATSP